MNKRKINSCCIQTSKRLDADERKHEDSWKLSSILYNKVEEQTRCQNSVEEKAYCQDLCGSSEDGSCGRGRSLRSIASNDVRKVSPSETRDGIGKDAFTGRDETLGMTGDIGTDAIIVNDEVMVKAEVLGMDADIGKGEVMGKDKTLGMTADIGKNTGMGKDETIGSDAFIGRYGAMEKDTTMGTDAVMGKDETIGSDAFIGRYGAIGRDGDMGRDADTGTWNADTDIGKSIGKGKEGRTMGDDNSGTIIPLEAFPKKIQEMAKVLVEYENYNQDYLLISMLSAVATAIGNTCQIRIKGCWTSSPILYVILVGRPGVGKTPPLDFAFKPIRAHDYKLLKKYKEDDEAYSLFMEKRKSRKFTYSQSEIPEIPILQRTVISDFTPEALMQAHNVNQRGIVAFVDEIMGMFNTVNQYSKGQLIEQLLTAHSGKPLDITRCSLDIPIHIEQPCINIIGTTQTKRVHELVDKGYGDNGLIDRILFAYPKRHTISPWQLHGTESNYDGRECFDLWADVVEKILALPCQYDDETGMVIPTIINFTAEAQQHFFDWRNRTVDYINSIKDDALIDGRIMKTHLNTARLALVIQMMRWACGEADNDNVDIDSVKAAIELGEYFEECYTRLQKYMTIDSIQPQKKILLDGLEHEFTTADALKIGEEMGLSERSVMYTLTDLQTMKVIRKIKRGEYEKLQ